VGGDYLNPKIALPIAAVSADTAKSWQAAQQQPSGYRSAVFSLDAQTFLAVGLTGADLSQDFGLHWTPFPSPPLNAAFALDANHIYVAGPKGVIAQFLTAESK